MSFINDILCARSYNVLILISDVIDNILFLYKLCYDDKL